MTCPVDWQVIIVAILGGHWLREGDGQMFSMLDGGVVFSISKMTFEVVSL